ncbi:MAG: methyltransferase domain-containing protein [Parcubacteria group bacterium]|nr:methyltransferase domain-containing protein [Parcubacteria group bacterium]
MQEKRREKKKMRWRKQKRQASSFWEKEYKSGEHLALSTSASEDLQKFTRWLSRENDNKTLRYIERFLPVNKYSTTKASVADLGTGNGRNLIYLAETFGMKGTGFDISREAIEQAKIASKNKNLPLEFFVRSIAEPIPLPDNSQDIVLDMMTSHFLNNSERAILLSEIARILKPGGFLFFKTFLLDEDIHAARLLREHPAGEPGSYIHPEIGKAEHVFTENEIVALFSHYFTIRKITKSHRHKIKGHAAKRRSISVYAEKEIR